MNIVFKKQVKTLFANSKKISNQIYSVKQLENLPEPVQKYFNYVLKDYNLTLVLLGLNTVVNLNQASIKIGQILKANNMPQLKNQVLSGKAPR